MSCHNIYTARERTLLCLHTNTYAVDRFYLEHARVQFGIAEN